MPRRREGVFKAYLLQEVDPLWLASQLYIVTFATGLLDAISYGTFYVFASNQTGNVIILLSLSLDLRSRYANDGGGPSILTVGVSLASFVTFAFLAGRIGLRYGHFTKEEWLGYEYDLDLQFQGDYGFMSPNGRAQGIGWVQEFLDRVTNTTLDSANVTLQNTTFDNSSTYFPLDQPFYFDFTHDDVILSVLTALNFTQIAGDYLNATYMDPNRTFVLSHITPFAARLYFEIVDCNNSTTVANSTAASITDTSSNSTQYIRTILNDAVVPMNEGQGCPSVENGLCPLADFIKYQQTYALEAANFNKTCFGVNGTDFTITGPSIRNGTLG